MKSQSRPMFLARESFRRRRLMDMARVLPFIGFVAVLLPLFWPAPEETAPATQNEMLYLFAVWVVLIISAAGIALRLTAAMDREQESDRRN